jgi:two-component system cell cycle sensor histidine kinase/response regulator CckA
MSGGDLEASERALRESEERFRAISNAAREAMIIHEDGVIREVNRAFTRLFGYEPEEIIGQSGLAMLIAPESREVVRKSLGSTGSGSATEIAMRTKSGERLVVDSYSEPLVFLGRPMRVVTMQDQTARIDAEQRRLALEDQFMHSQRMEATGKLAGGIAHDFNNLLTVILANAQLAALRLPPNHAAASSLQQIEAAAHRAAALTRQLLIFARKEIVAPKLVDLNQIVHDLAQLLRRVVGEHIELLVELGEGVWPILIDTVQCEQVLMNLAVNARDAMPAGGVLKITTRNLRGGADGRAAGDDGVELCVTDTGVGMSDETRAKAFEPFFTTKSAGRGTGLGLSTCHAVVTRAGGTIAIERAPLHGTTFRIVLPRARGQGAPMSLPAPVKAPARGTETILLVEDDAEVRNLAAEMLGSLGYRVLVAARPEEALGLACSHPREVALILSDVVMPGQSGPALVRALGATQPQAKTLFVSGYPGDEIERFGVSEQSHPILAKPYTLEELARRAREVMDETGA